MSALRFARRVHLGQYRKQTGEQFVEHPIAVAKLVADGGYDGPLIAAAYLHDVVEKTDVSLDEIRERFGPRVAALIDCLSEDPDIEGYGDRKRALRRGILDSGADPVAIYAADRVANMRDWLKVAPEDRPACGERLGTTLKERLELWTEDVEELHDLNPETPFLSEIQADLAELKAHAPR
ncbi:MAG TPA: HD domain-containing protein [Solirubrobacterales bacterium]|nr:HD domain-containing protein [Solirubrobacterales bacterium]